MNQYERGTWEQKRGEQGGRSFNVIPITVFFFADFDDMSCEMIFGKEPPASIDDPALKQPCYKLCIYLNTSLLPFLIITFYLFTCKWRSQIYLNNLMG